MTVMNQAIDYIMNLEKDFSVSDIMEAGFCRSTSHTAKTRLYEASAIFNVGLRYVKSGECKLYNKTYRPYSHRPCGKPKTENQQVMEYMLWVENDYTIMQIREDLGVSRTVSYKAAKKLREAGLIFHVGYIQNGTIKVKVFSKKERALTTKEVGTLKKYKPVTKAKKPVKKQTRPKYTPKDPLKGFFRPVDRSLDGSICNG